MLRQLQVRGHAGVRFELKADRLPECFPSYLEKNRRSKELGQGGQSSCEPQWQRLMFCSGPIRLQVMSAFEAGDHVMVKRLLYSHHGIFVNDSRVIDFSGGRNIFEKPKALVQARTLKAFEGKRGRAEKVEHPGKFLGGLGFWPGPEWEHPPAEVVRRAEALCQVAATRGAYRLSGSNCEHIANWCKSGAHESKQVRYVHAGHVVFSLGLLVALSRGPSKWKPALVFVALASSMVTIYMQCEAWTTPRRWRPIITAAEAVLRESGREADEE